MGHVLVVGGFHVGFDQVGQVGHVCGVLVGLFVDIVEVLSVVGFVGISVEDSVAADVGLAVSVVGDVTTHLVASGQ